MTPTKSVSFLEVLHHLPRQQQEELADLFYRQPEMMARCQRWFYAKLAAGRNADTKGLAAILKEEETYLQQVIAQEQQ